MTIQQKFKLWCQNVSQEHLPQLLEIQGDDNKLNQAFLGDLKFGTAGMRSVMGMGTSGLNVYTIAKATKGVAQFLKQTLNKQIKVAISYDNRRHGKLFAERCALVFCGELIQCFLFEEPTATPLLAFATRQLGCDLGVMITASHNSAEYNGFKIFDSFGTQFVETDEIARLIGLVDVFDIFLPNLDELKSNRMLQYVDDTVVDMFIKNLDTLVDHSEDCSLSNLDVVYTPLNGTGGSLMPQLIEKYNAKLFVVPEQSFCDGDFVTCPHPNPEHASTFKLALEYAQQLRSDIVIATDPDADRVGAMVLHEGDYRHLSGNEVGILLTQFLLSQNATSLSPIVNPLIVRTVVSTPLVDRIASYYGAKVKTTLTGFKYIGTHIKYLQDANATDNFLIGFEESMGYLVGTHIGDKDSFVATVLLLQVAALAKRNGKTIVDRLKQIYEQFGCFCNETVSVKFDGVEGASFIDKFMADLRCKLPTQFGRFKVMEVQDFFSHSDPLMRANLLLFKLECDATILIRPSGTEPLLKVYLMVLLSDSADATMMQELKLSVNQLVNDVKFAGFAT